jgi:capsular exopolysaccharide synthesis family protein
MSQDNRLLPYTSTNQAIDRPLRDLVQTIQPPSPLVEQAHLREYMAIILKRKWLILSIVIVVTTIVAIQMYRLPPIYQGITQIQIEREKPSVLGRGGVPGATAATSDPNYWNTQLKLLQTPSLARKVVRTLDLQNNPAFLGGQANTGVFTAIRRLFSRQKQSTTTAGALPVDTNAEMFKSDEDLSPEELERLEPYENSLIANLGVYPIEKTNLVNIAFTHSDPVIAKKVADTLADVFVWENKDRETSGALRAAEKLAKQIADLQLKIRQGEEARQSYLREHDLPTGNAQGQPLVVARVNMLSNQLLQAENERKAAESVYEAAIKEEDVWSVPEVQADQQIQKFRDKITELEERKAALLVQYTEEWPEVIKINKQIERIKEYVEKRPQEVIKSLKQRYEAALKKEAKLRASYDKEYAAAGDLNRAEINLSIITRELETNKQYYDTLVQRKRELEITSDDRPQSVQVITYSPMPREPVGPKRGRNIIIAFLLSLGAGIGLAFLLDYLDDTLKSIEDVDRYVQLPTLAMIPAPRVERPLLKKGPAPDDAGPTTALALVSDARSHITEAYRHLRTSLLLSSAGQPPKSILVTSSQPSEGKTTTAVNTAMMLAQTGAQVVIVDCDLRRPRIHTHFSLPNTRGVSNYLSGDRDIDALLQPYGALPNLVVLTAGPVPPNPAELLGSDEMRRLISLLSQRFNHVIIDSPPAVSFTDAAILSTMVDGVMLVVHSGRSSRGVVRRAKQQLLDVGAHIYGIVLNNVKPDSQGYYYYTSYYADYYEDEEAAPDAAPAGAAGRETT